MLIFLLTSLLKVQKMTINNHKKILQNDIFCKTIEIFS